MVKAQKTKILEEDDFSKLENPGYDLEKEKEQSEKELHDSYMNIIDMLKKYCDLNESDYPIVAIWILGTYFPDESESLT